MDIPAYYLQVDALYFQARESGVAYAITDNKVLNPEFNSRWGGKITLGMETCWDSLQFYLQFLHYHSRTLNEKTNKKNFPTWSLPTDLKNGFADSVFNLWRLHMGMLDVCGCWGWVLSPTFEFWPVFGVRYGEIRQKLHIVYQNGPLFPDTEDDISMKNKFWGVGPIGGIKGFWNWNCHFGLYSYLTGSFLWGKLYVHQDEEDMKHPERVDFKLFNIYPQGLPIFDGGLGLFWRFRSPQECFLFYGQIGWEIHLLLGQNQLMHFVNRQDPAKFVTHQGDISIQGLTVGAGFEF